MTLHRGAQRAVIAIFFAGLAAIYAMAWLAPAIGLYHDDGSFLISAKALAAGHGYDAAYPPLFPAILALFTLVSSQPQWLKLLPLLCAAGWLTLTRSLLIKMGASRDGALLLVGLTAASPVVVFLSTNLMAETLFALLMTAALLMLLEDRPLPTALFAGLATLTSLAGLPLIAACIITLVVRRRFRSAAVFTLVAIVMVTPWLGWAFAQGGGDYAASNILTGLAANEKAIVLSRNLLYLLYSPFSLLSGMNNIFAAIAAVLVFGWSLFVRRQFLPDVFVGIYCLMVLCVASPPERLLAPLLPLVFWIVWRVFRMMELREALYAAVLLSAALPLWADVGGLAVARTSGYFQAGGSAANDWNEMGKLFAAIRSETPQDSILLGNQDAAIHLNTGRKTVRGFTARGFTLYYAERQSVLSPDQLSVAISHQQVNYVVLTPDRDLPESPSFHKAVDALERGGVLEPVSAPGLAAGYRILRVTR